MTSSFGAVPKTVLTAVLEGESRDGDLDQALLTCAQRSTMDVRPVKICLLGVCYRARSLSPISYIEEQVGDGRGQELAGAALRLGPLHRHAASDDRRGLFVKVVDAGRNTLQISNLGYGRAGKGAEIFFEYSHLFHAEPPA